MQAFASLRFPSKQGGEAGRESSMFGEAEGRQIKSAMDALIESPAESPSQ
jgi:hypothetical protein